MHEIREIKKDLVQDKLSSAKPAHNRVSVWEALSKKISSKWSGYSAVEEIAQQREKG